MSDFIDINKGKGGVGFRIKELYVVVADHLDDKIDEGVCAIMSGGTWVPLVAADHTRLREIRELARRLSRETGRPLKLVKFSVREDVETIRWGG